MGRQGPSSTPELEQKLNPNKNILNPEKNSLNPEVNDINIPNPNLNDIEKKLKYLDPKKLVAIKRFLEEKGLKGKEEVIGDSKDKIGSLRKELMPLSSKKMEEILTKINRHKKATGFSESEIRSFGEKLGLTEPEIEQILREFNFKRNIKDKYIKDNDIVKGPFYDIKIDKSYDKSGLLKKEDKTTTYYEVNGRRITEEEYFDYKKRK